MPEPVPFVRLFALPGLLQADMRLLVDVPARIMLVLLLERGEVSPHSQTVHLTPSSVRILYCLAKAYPLHCSYRELFCALYPESWSLDIRPVRRAVCTLVPALRAFGIEATALRKRGYLLAPAKEQEAQQRDVVISLAARRAS